ncbi:hypothetical protein RHSIM_Rhsim10G0182100 [Rhododendron simsii]|uniref:Integrase catalytic domain-containing protein n=1 Tax=Rhododendron simsii TaxID=118357 RepID=A0A834GE73_RHOSS|nr:hypothetical protein RHSIM_Rhsim10G0182100 [Rhododendron simsii]
MRRLQKLELGFPKGRVSNASRRSIGGWSFWSQGTFEWVVMSFSLKNVGAMFQRAMNAIFHDFISHFMEIYIDDIVVKSQSYDEHLEHLRKSFLRMGTIFMGEQVINFAAQQNIIVSNSTPYNAQGNGQAESTNRTLVNIIEKMVEDNPRAWHELLSEALWAYRTSNKEATNVTPYMLVYGHDPVLPMEIAVKSARIASQNGLTPADYTQAMLMELEDLDEVRLAALDHMLVQKGRVVRFYD